MKMALLFPGQGSQKVGMATKLARGVPAARGVFKEAYQTLRFWPSLMVFRGTGEERRVGECGWAGVRGRCGKCGGGQARSGTCQGKRRRGGARTQSECALPLSADATRARWNGSGAGRSRRGPA